MVATRLEPSCVPHTSLGTERFTLGTFRGLGTERVRGTFRGFDTERARLSTLNQSFKFSGKTLCFALVFSLFG